MLSRLIVLRFFLFLSVLVSNLTVQRLRPLGAFVHACAIISASCFFVYFLGCPLLGFSSNAMFSPSSRNLFFILHILCLWTFSILNMVLTSHPSSNNKRTFALAIALAFFVPFLKKSFRNFRSSFFSFIFVCFIVDNT